MGRYINVTYGFVETKLIIIRGNDVIVYDYRCLYSFLFYLLYKWESARNNVQNVNVLLIMISHIKSYKKDTK